MSPAPLGVAFTAHWLPLQTVLRVVRRADELGYSLVFVDGDSVLADANPARPIYDATALSAAAVLATRQARIAAIHLAITWNALLLARSLSTLQELAAGRLVAMFGVGAKRASHRLGLPEPGGAERVDRLDEMLGAVRALLAGEAVSLRGRFTTLERASVTTASAPVPIAVSAAGARALDVVRRHADAWDANVPPLRERLLPLRHQLARPIPTWCWVFARPGASFDDAAHAYRRHAPWFRGLGPGEVERAILYGEPARCREKLECMREELDLALPVVDLTGLDEARAMSALEALAPALSPRIS
jgi:alkanesulfonate monooxygenase SsuD/methylene tetrahydromethanopterin reductase-like flavin-dependent oxidoreductase (luciferase family)